MPVFEVTDPNTGQTLELTGDSPPTEAELEEVFSNIPAAKPVEEPVQEPGFFEQAQEAITGAQRTSALPEDVQALPELQSLTTPITTGEFGSDIQVAAGLLSSFDPEARKDIIKNAVPGVEFEEFEGTTVVNLPNGQRAVINAPGLSTSDVLAGIGQALAFVPAGRIASFGKNLAQRIGLSGAASGATEAGLQGVSQALGSEQELDKGQIALATGLGGAAELVAPAIPAAKTGLGKLSERFGKKGDVLAEEAADIRTPTEATEEALEAGAKAIQGGSPEDIGALVQADPNFFKAADELGLSVEPLASFTSQNPQFRAIEGGLASIPASQLDNQSKAFINEVTKKADEIIQEYGGTLDKASLSEKFRRESLDTIDNIYGNEKTVYDTIGKELPTRTAIESVNTVKYIENLAADLGGVDKLSGALRKLLIELRPKVKTKTTPGEFSVVTGKGAPVTVTEEALPTYGLLNSRRSEIGQQLGRKGNTQFKDANVGQLKALYSNMKKDQDAVAQTFGLGNLVKVADGLTVGRKQVEDNMKKLLGDKLSSDLLPVLSGSIRGLARGDLTKFKQTISAIPENLRSEAVISAFNDVFKGTGVGQQALNPTQFTKFMKNLDRSPTLKKALFDELPEDSIQAIENMQTVNAGISRALGDRITTGRVSAFFDENNALMNKLMGKGAQALATKAAGPLAGNVVGEFLGQSSDIAITANKMLASSRFQGIVRDSVKEGVIEGGLASRKLQNAEKAFAKSKLFKDWASSLPEAEFSKLTRVGLISYFLTDKANETQ